MQIRLATAADAPQIQAIYIPYVRDTVISFEFDPPSVAEIEQRITTTLERLPWLVALDGERITGYAYAGQHKTRAAYQWSVDVSVYMAQDQHRRGIGRLLYGDLFALLVRQGFRNAYAGITLPNAASVGLHEALGFRPVGIYERVGYKFGVWHDVGWWQLTLAPHDPEPTAPVSIHDILNA